MCFAAPYRRYSSVGLEYSFDQLPTPQALSTMLEKSPIVHAAQVRKRFHVYLMFNHINMLHPICLLSYLVCGGVYVSGVDPHSSFAYVRWEG